MTLRLPALGAAAASVLLIVATSAPTPSAGLAPERATSAGASLQIALEPEILRPWLPNPVIETQREALHQHLKELALPAETVSSVLSRILAAAQQGIVPADDIALATADMEDAEAQAKAREMLTAFAELATFGEPISAALDVQGAPRIEARAGQKSLLAGEIELPGMEPVDAPEPRIGGVCLSCPNFDYAIAPSPVYQTHTASIAPGFNDCAWYAVPVVANRRYEFTTCAPGSATWDTVIEVYNSAACATLLADNDDCSPPPAVQRQSTVLWDATFTGSARVRVRGYDSASAGTYTMAYRDLGVVCDTCASPNAASLPSPSATWSCVTGATTTSCRSDFYIVNLTAGETYTFTTCPTNAPAATASYDTRLRLWSPTCGLLADNDDSCASPLSRSTLSFTAIATGPHRIEVLGRTASPSIGILTGTYSLCYRRTSAACGSCGPGPFLSTLTPLPVCQDHASNVTACQDNWYRVNLSEGVEYEFTTCNISGACMSGGAVFDTVIDLRDPGCNLVASNDDGCGGTGSKVTYTVPAGAGGVYRLLVKGKSGSTGAYTLTYREVTQSCVPPTALALTPGGGLTDALNCARTQRFAVSTDGDATLPVTYSWSVTTPGGGVAAPPLGTVTTADPAGATTFETTLSREGTYTVNVTVSNDCGSYTESFPYVLVDDIRPVVTAPPSDTVECTAVPAPAAPTVRDNCDPDPEVAMTETTIAGPCPGNYALRRQWTATDRSGNASLPAFQVIVVRDTQAPTITPDSSVQYCAYPPNHDVVCFDRTMFSPVVSDACSEPVTWRFFRVTSSEAGLSPCGSGNQDPDTFVSADGSTFCIRSERCGNDPAENDGRRYLVEAVATDACGNTSAPMPIGFVLVPHDNSDTSSCIYPTPIPLP